MNRLPLVHLLTFACTMSLLSVQGQTPAGGGVSDSNNTTTPPIPSRDYCNTCNKETGKWEEVPKDPDNPCPEGTTLVSYNGSVELTFGVGTTSYNTINNIVSQDLQKHQLIYKSYNSPSLDSPPVSSSLSREWGRKLIRPVKVALVTDDITNTTFTTSALELYGDNAGNAYVKKDSSGALRQILSDQYLTDITAANGAILIRSYYRTSIGALDSGSGLYAISGAKLFREIRISRPTLDGLDTLDALLTDYSSSEAMPKIRGYRWLKSGTGNNATWILSLHSGAPTDANIFTTDTLVKADLGNGLIQRTRTIVDQTTDTPVTTSVTREKYRDLGSGIQRIFEKVDAPGTPEELTTTYTYTDATGTGGVGLDGFIIDPRVGSPTNTLTGGRLASLRRSDGYWEDYSYQYNGGTNTMLTQKWTCWKNSTAGDHAASRLTTIILDGKSRSVVEKIAGVIVSSESETLDISADGARTVRTETSADGQSKRITEYGYYSDSASPPNNGRIQYIRHTDGTCTTYSYTMVGNDLKTVNDTGVSTAPELSSSAPVIGKGPVQPITYGTRTETLENVFERLTSKKISDIATGLVLEQSIASSVDDLGRPTQVIHDADADDYETFSYACCGLQDYRARDGSVTHYIVDLRERPAFTTVSLGGRVTTTCTSYTSETIGGRLLPKTKTVQYVTVGSNTTDTITLSETITNLRGQPLVSRSPSVTGPGTSDTTYTYVPATRTITRLGSDGVATTQTYYADGQLYSSGRYLGNTAITLLTNYDYVTHTLNGGGIRILEQITDGATVLSYVTTYSDLLGRAFRTERPGYNGSTIFSTVTYDSAGRLVATTSSGHPAKFKVYDAIGQTNEIWTDANGDNVFNNTSVSGIKDGYQRKETLVVNVDGIPMRRTRIWVRDDNNNDILLSTIFTTPDGLYTKTSPVSDSVTITAARKPLNGSTSSQTKIYINSTDFLTQNSSTSIDANGATITQQTDTTGVTRTQISDVFGRTISESDGRTPATTYSDFTASGTATKITSGDSTYTINTLDSAGRVTQANTYNVGTTLVATQNTTYNPTGAVVAKWGTNTYPTYRVYDIQGRLTELRTYRSNAPDLNPVTTTSAYDVTIWSYENATGLLLSKTDANTKSVNYTYTADGKIQSRKWARGVVIEYGYQNNLLTSINYSSASGWAAYEAKRNIWQNMVTHPGDYTSAQIDAAKTEMDSAYAARHDAATPAVSIAYDRLGRRTLVSNGIAKTTYDYNADTLALHLETISYDLDGQPGYEFTRVLDHTQDGIGRDAGWQLKNGPIVENEATYGYSATDGRLSSVTGGGNIASPKLFSYHYLDNSNLIDSITSQVHKVTNQWEDNRDVLDWRKNEVGTTTVSMYDYTVSAIGQRTHVDQTGGEFQSGRSISWGYDALGQVTGADSTVNADDRAYQYDTIGNRIEARNQVTTTTSTPNYTANSLNQYTAIGTLTPTYDFDGNMTSGQLPASASTNSLLTWDADNRMTATTLGEVTTTYLYDAFSRRIAKTTGEATTLFVYDRWNCIAEYTGTTPALTKAYLWGLDFSGSLQGAGGVGGLLTVRLGSDDFFPTYDGNCNVSEYLGSSGSVVAHFEYDPYGNIVVNTDTTGLFNYRFSTKPMDSETGLYYYLYRYFDPVTGRWPSRDPVEENGGANLYGFLGNDGILTTDYLGLLYPLISPEVGSAAKETVSKILDATKPIRNFGRNANLGVKVIRLQIKQLQAQIDDLKAQILISQIFNASLEECKKAKSESGTPCSDPGSGCCITKVGYRKSTPGYNNWLWGTWVPPSGLTVSVDWTTTWYVPKPCKDAVLGQDYESSIYDGTYYVEETRMVDM